MDFVIDEMQPTDWPQVAEIYWAGIETGLATFQREVPSWEEWNKDHCETCRLVARSDDKILGWATLTQVSSRCVYAGVAETSVYISKEYRAKGIGKALLTELIRHSEEAGYWSIQAAITKENIPSRGLCKKCGFREIGICEKLGRMPNSEWHDVVLMERRSKTVG
jgi:L-amino acid N-acyltransferase YncA